MQGPGKKWEHYDLNKNGKPVRIPMHVRKGDTVQIISGRDKGMVGEVSLVRLLTFLPHPDVQILLCMQEITLMRVCLLPYTACRFRPRPA